MPQSIEKLIIDNYIIRGSLPDYGFILRSGHATSHVIPVVQGRPSHRHMLRVDIAGSSVTNFLQSIVQLSHPTVKLNYQISNHLKGNTLSSTNSLPC